MKQLKKDLQRLNDMRRGYTVAMVAGYDCREFLNGLALAITRLEDLVAIAQEEVRKAKARNAKARVAARALTTR